MLIIRYQVQHLIWGFDIGYWTIYWGYKPISVLCNILADPTNDMSADFSFIFTDI